MANDEARVRIICSLDILMCVAGKPKPQTHFIFSVEDKLCDLLEFVELLPTVRMAHSSTDTFSLFIRLHCSTPPESKQLFLDLPVI